MKRSILFMTAALTAAVAVTPCPAQTPPFEIITDEGLTTDVLVDGFPSQPVNYYSGRDIIYGMNVTYKITRGEILSKKLRGTGHYILSSTLNTKGTSEMFASGRPMISLFERYPTFTVTKRNKRQLDKALFKSFSKEQICNMCHTMWDTGKGDFSVILCATSDGRIDEVQISIPRDTEYMYTFIMPDRYFEFETNVKRYVRFYRNKKEVADIMAWTSMSMRCIPFRPEQATGRLKRIAKEYMKTTDAASDGSKK